MAEKIRNGGLYAKGRFGTGLLQTKRLLFPLVRKGGTLTGTSWEEAIKAAAKVLRNAVEKHGADAVGVIAAPRMTLEEAWLTKQVAGAMGTKEIGDFGQARRGGKRADLDGILAARFPPVRWRTLRTPISYCLPEPTLKRRIRRLEWRFAAR